MRLCTHWISLSTTACSPLRMPAQRGTGSAKRLLARERIKGGDCWKWQRFKSWEISPSPGRDRLWGYGRTRCLGKSGRGSRFKVTSGAALHFGLSLTFTAGAGFWYKETVSHIEDFGWSLKHPDPAIAPEEPEVHPTVGQGPPAELQDSEAGQASKVQPATSPGHRHLWQSTVTAAFDPMALKNVGRKGWSERERHSWQKQTRTNKQKTSARNKPHIYLRHSVFNAVVTLDFILFPFKQMW